MIKANIHDAKTNLSRLIEQALAGEDVVIAKAGKPLVRLSPIAEAKPSHGSWLGKFPGEVRFASDYDQADAEIERLFYGEDGDKAPVVRGVAEE